MRLHPITACSIAADLHLFPLSGSLKSGLYRVPWFSVIEGEREKWSTSEQKKKGNGGAPSTRAAVQSALSSGLLQAPDS